MKIEVKWEPILSLCKVDPENNPFQPIDYEMLLELLLTATDLINDMIASDEAIKTQEQGILISRLERQKLGLRQETQRLIGGINLDHAFEKDRIMTKTAQTLLNAEEILDDIIFSLKNPLTSQQDK